MINNIRILGIDYSVQHCDMRKKTSDDTAVGSIDNHACTITVDSHVNCSAHAKSVLLHEIFEVLVYRLSLGLPHEKICQIEAGLIQVIRDNPKLIKYISEADGGRI